MAIGLFLLTACGDEYTLHIDEASFEGRWPFSVPDGTLSCYRDAVVFTHGDTNYALNGTAGSRGYADIKPIWSDDPKWPVIPGTTTPLADISDVLKLGQTLC
jgi:hypothetical protein